MAQLSNSKIVNTCLVILTAFAIIAGLIYTKQVFVPFVFSVLLYLILRPLFMYLQVKLKLPKIVALLTTFVVLGLSLAIVLTLIVTSINSFARGADVYQDRINSITAEATLHLNNMGFVLNNVNLLDAVKNFPVVAYIKKFSTSMVTIFGNLVLVGFFCLFLLTSDNRMQKKPNLLSKILGRISTYVSTKIIISFVTGILVGIVLFAFNVELAFMFALMAFLLNFIPNIGSIVATIIPLPIILLQFGVGTEFIALLILLTTIQVSIGNLIEPKIMGEAMDLHPITVLMSLIFWGLVWGVAGMFLAVPITSICRIVFSRIESTKSFSEVMAGRF